MTPRFCRDFACYSFVLANFGARSDINRNAIDVTIDANAIDFSQSVNPEI